MRQQKADKILVQTVQVYNEIADHFSETRYQLWPEIDGWRSHLTDGERVLDIGCGSGRLLELFSSLKHVSYFGLDASRKLIEIAQSNCKEYTLQNVTFQVGNALELPYHDDFFDKVFCVATLQHVPSDEYRFTAVKEIYRVLRPGGKLFLTNWYLWNAAVARKYGIKRQQKVNWLRGFDKHDLLIPWKNTAGNVRANRYYHAFKKSELRFLLEQNGFIIEQHYISSGVEDKEHNWQRENLVTIARRA